jgi:flagellar protein FlgJ
MAMDTSVQLKHSLDMASNYHDLSGIDKLRQAAKSDDETALRAAAEQFEGIFMGMLLKSMRQASDVLADQDSPLNSQQVSFYRDMYDKQLTAELAGKDGLGLADIIVQQFGGDKQFMPASALRHDGDLRRVQADLQQAREFPSEQAVAPPLQVEKKAAFNAPHEFIQTLRPLAQDAAEQLGIDAEALLAQAAVETGWGRYMMHADEQNAHNLFGIKADKRWHGEHVTVPTLEYGEHGKQTQLAQFRKYQSFGESFADYVEFIQTQPRYADARAANGNEAYFTALQAAGYATDPNYAQKIMHVMRGDTMREALSFGAQQELGE